MVASTGLRDTGAVASSRAAEIYGLEILSDKVQVRLFLYFIFLGSVYENHLFVCIINLVLLWYRSGLIKNLTCAQENVISWVLYMVKLPFFSLSICY